METKSDVIREYHKSYPELGVKDLVERIKIERGLVVNSGVVWRIVNGDAKQEPSQTMKLSKFEAGLEIVRRYPSGYSCAKLAKKARSLLGVKISKETVLKAARQLRSTGEIPADAFLRNRWGAKKPREKRASTIIRDGARDTVSFDLVVRLLEIIDQVGGASKLQLLIEKLSKALPSK